jgi:hypothetical protein
VVARSGGQWIEVKITCAALIALLDELVQPAIAFINFLQEKAA